MVNNTGCSSEDPGSIPITYMVVYNFNFTPRGSNTLFWPLNTLHACGTQANMEAKTPIYIKLLKFFFFSLKKRSQKQRIQTYYIRIYYFGGWGWRLLGMEPSASSTFPVSYIPQPTVCISKFARQLKWKFLEVEWLDRSLQTLPYLKDSYVFNFPRHCEMISQSNCASLLPSAVYTLPVALYLPVYG